MTTIEVKQPRNPINKLSENTTYIIKDYYKIETKFGYTYVMVDNNYKRYWSTSRINTYLSTKPEKSFKLETFYYNEFINKQNQHIKYLNYQISSLPKKEIEEKYSLFN